MTDVISLEDFGAVGDGQTDCLSAWNEAMAEMGPVQDGNFYNNVGKILEIPAGNWFFSETPKISRYCVVRGAAFGAWPRSQIVVPEGVAGLEFSPATSRDAIVERIGVRALSKNGAAVPGIRVLSTAQIRDFYIYGFKGNGLELRGDSESPPFGNVNDSRVTTGRIYSCDGHGLSVTGYDAQVCHFDNVSIEGVGEWGIWGAGFLGNLYTSCHVDSQGLIDDEAGPYRGSSAQPSVFLNCYAESSYGESRILAPCAWLLGAHGFDADTGRQFTEDSTGFLWPASGNASPLVARNSQGAVAIESSLGEVGSLLRAFAYRQAEGTEEEREWFRLALIPALKVWMWHYGQSEYGASWAHTAPGHVRPGADRPSLPGEVYFPKGVGFGIGYGMGANWADFCRIVFATAPPTADNGWFRRGDMVFHASPGVNDPVGWRCVAEGNPGTWQAFP